MIAKHKGEVRNDDANVRVSVRPVCSPSICVVSLVSSFMDGPWSNFWTSRFLGAMLIISGPVQYFCMNIYYIEVICGHTKKYEKMQSIICGGVVVGTVD